MRLSAAFVIVACLQSAAWAQTPAVAENGVLNGASFTRGQAVSPGSIVSVFGTDLAPDTARATSIPLPTSLSGVSVSFNDIAAPLIFVSATQINAQLPVDVLPAGTGTVNVVVTRAGVRSAPRSVQIGPFSPGIFVLSGQAIAINTDGALAAPFGSIPGILTHPAQAGDTIIVLATGLGAVAPPILSGRDSTDVLRRTTTTPAVLIGGREATVVFSGLSPQFVGVNQLNVTVPAGVSGDRLAIQLRVGGITSTDQTTIAVAAAAAGPPSLRQVGSVSILGSNPRSVAVNGSIAYVCGSENITVVDISDPSNPRVTGRVADELFNNVGNLSCYVDRGRLIATADTGSSLVSGTSPSVAVFDISDATQPRLIRATAINKQFMGLGYVRNNTVIVPTNSISFSGSSFLDQRGDVLAVDITDPNTAGVAGTLFTGQPGFNASTGGANSVFTAAPADSDTALVGSSTSTGPGTGTGSGRIFVVDISQANNVRLVREVLVSGTRQINNIAVDGGLAVAIGNVEGWRNPINFPQGALVGPTVVTTFDLADARNPRVIRTSSTTVRPDLRGGGNAVVGAGRFVFGGTRIDDRPVLLVVDARDRNNAIATTVDSAVTVNDVRFANGYLYAALEGTGMAVYRVE